MSRTAELRALVTQRLTAAAEDILVLFERSIAEYEQEVLELTHHNGSQQHRPSSQPRPSCQPSPETESTTDIIISSVRQVSAPIKVEAVEQLQEPTFPPVCLKTEPVEDQLLLHYPIPTEEESREESHGSDLEEEAAPLTPQNSDGEEDSDSSDTDDSDNYDQEEVPAKRSKAMSSSSDSSSTDSDNTQSGSSEHIPFSCLECGKTLHDKKKIAQHMKTHIGQPTFRCIICDKSFRTIPDLTRHKRKVHFICKYCPRRFGKKRDLKMHMIVHTKERKEKSFPCLKCKKRFTRERALIDHQKSHKEYEPFRCSTCTATFSTQTQRSNHMKLHNKGNRAFACEMCSKAFSAQHQLVEHMKTHCEDRPFQCPACGKGFDEQVDLTVHLKLVHHICPVCSKGFQDKFALKSHLGDHTQAQLKDSMTPFVCSDCGKRFSREAALQRHVLVHSEKIRLRDRVTRMQDQP